MNVVLTDAARSKLLAAPVSPEKSPRLDAEMNGGCGVSVRFSLVFDGPRPHDVLISCGEGVFLRMDRFTARYLESGTVIDYSETKGFIIGPAFEAGCGWSD